MKMPSEEERWRRTDDRLVRYGIVIVFLGIILVAWVFWVPKHSTPRDTSHVPDAVPTGRVW